MYLEGCKRLKQSTLLLAKKNTYTSLAFEDVKSFKGINRQCVAKIVQEKEKKIAEATFHFITSSW